VNGTYREWFAQHGPGVVLQRPDFRIFGTAPAVDGTATLVQRLRELVSRAA